MHISLNFSRLTVAIPYRATATTKTWINKGCTDVWNGHIKWCRTQVTGESGRKNSLALIQCRYEIMWQGTTETKLFLSTNPDPEAHEVLLAYSLRWPIEPMFQQLKDGIAMDAYKNGGLCTGAITDHLPKFSGDCGSKSRMETPGYRHSRNAQACTVLDYSAVSDSWLLEPIWAKN